MSLSTSTWKIYRYLHRYSCHQRLPLCLGDAENHQHVAVDCPSQNVAGKVFWVSFQELIFCPFSHDGSNTFRWIEISWLTAPTSRALPCITKRRIFRRQEARAFFPLMQPAMSRNNVASFDFGLANQPLGESVFYQLGGLTSDHCAVQPHVSNGEVSVWSVSVINGAFWSYQETEVQRLTPHLSKSCKKGWFSLYHPSHKI